MAIVETGLAQRVAIVTGAGSGIGLATTKALVAEGARVVAADLDPAAALLGAPEGRVIGVTVDLATAEGPVASIDTAIERFGRLDLSSTTLVLLRRGTAFSASATATGARSWTSTS